MNSSSNSISIEIKKTYEDLYVFIDLDSNKILINNKEKYIKDEKIYDLIRIIRLWDSEYFDNKFIDSEEFIIKIISDNSIETIKGKGKYPENYSTFKNWLGDFYE